MSRFDATDSSTALVSAHGRQVFLRLSPNGRWLAYMSNESGPWEIWLNTFPVTGPGRKVSIAGGSQPVWSPAGDRLYYRRGDTVHVVNVDPLTGRFGRPAPFITGPFLNVPGWSYDVSADGRRLLLIQGPIERTGNQIRFIRDFDRVIREAIVSK
ncbi:MAG: TolB family protein [Longimicrobiales bacterium]